MPNYSWSKYNKINSKLSSQLMKFNDLNDVNFIETGLYNHIRDIFCLTAISFKLTGFKSSLEARSAIAMTAYLPLVDNFIVLPYSKD